MKKLFLFVLAAFLLLPVSVSAQLTLEPNQMIMGHYDSDAVKTSDGWKMPGRTGVIPIATDLTSDEIALFQGGSIVAFRVGLAASTPVTRVFVIPITPEGTLETMVQWSCNVSAVGWNTIELATPYLIDLPQGYGLRIGFDYKQTVSNYPISAVQEGEIYSSYCYVLSKWYKVNLEETGNLSVQCIVENDNFPEYSIDIESLSVRKMIKLGDPINFSFIARNRCANEVAAGAFTYQVAVDGNPVAEFDNEVNFSTDFVTFTESLNSADFEPGIHTLTVTTSTVNGEPIERPMVLSAEFKIFEHGFARQMHLVEQFTSTGCTYCPLGVGLLQSLSNARGDIAWVGVHGNLGVVDPFKTSQCDSIMGYVGTNSYPTGTFDRSLGANRNDANALIVSLGYGQSSYATMVRFFNSFYEAMDEVPSWASVFINSTYDAATRKAVITVNGEVTPDFDEIMGSDSRLTVYITEDGLIEPQYDNGNWDNDFEHNGVFRVALGGVRGVQMNRDGNTYSNEFTVTIPSGWNADNLDIVAFVSRPLRSGNSSDLYVTNTNKRHLGESGSNVMKGDVNGDNNIDIGDVTLLISYVLNGEAPGIILDACDCEEDGIINISDVTILIAYVLNGTW